MGTRSFPGVNCGRGVLLTAHPLLVSWWWKSRAIPLPTLWATPSLYPDHFTFTLIPSIRSLRLISENFTRSLSKKFSCLCHPFPTFNNIFSAIFKQLSCRPLPFFIYETFTFQKFHPFFLFCLRIWFRIYLLQRTFCLPGCYPKI